MPKDFSKLQIAMPDFHDRELFLKACGKIVVDEIIEMIEHDQKPDGTNQKRNSKAYEKQKLRLKGYTTPLKGISNQSPYLARPSGKTFTRAFFEPDTLEIFPNTKRYMIMVYLGAKGYWFMGITAKAERLIKARVSNYFRNKVHQMKTYKSDLARIGW